MFVETGKPSGLPHNPFKACVVPRPIGWISTLSVTGEVNLAPFSFFNACSADPPIVMYCANGTHAEGGWKDSLKNVEATGAFVASLATYELRRQVNTTSMPAGRGIDEMALAGLTPAPSRLVPPPGVAESPIRMECVLHRILELPAATNGGSNHAVFGRVVGIHLDDGVLTGGMVDIGKLQPLSRLGYMDYAVTREVFQMERPHGATRQTDTATGSRR
jgi:flavin reductase (DIM6/NTAB) family NADH-FMN oxidoreductase RutF